MMNIDLALLRGWLVKNDVLMRVMSKLGASIGGSNSNAKFTGAEKKQVE